MLNLHAGLYTDLYELAMAQAYFKNGKKDIPACFDYTFRNLPYNGGYAVFAGLQDLLEWLENLHFEDDDIAYLKTCGFQSDFLDSLKPFRFNGAVYAVREGEIVFPIEPILRVEGTLIETQIVETCLLNFLNFQTLIATKAARIRQAAGDKILSDFGLRRAHALGGIQASRAAIIGGFNSTSNVYAAHRYGIPAVGTMAHAYVQSYDDERTAFREFARAHPHNCILLVDTYDTLKSGLPNAICIAKEMAAAGGQLLGIRLDSGDLAYMAKRTRKMLDESGLPDVKIAVSNQLDEYALRSLMNQHAPIDIFGVGTRLVTGHPDGALDGVYKLCMADGRPRLKISETLAKVTLPGVKTLFRYTDDNGYFQADAIAISTEKDTERMYDPFERERSLGLFGLHKEPLLEKVMAGGKIVSERPALEEIAKYAKHRLAQVPDEHKRFENPHIYKVGISRKLMHLRDQIVKHYRKGDAV